MLKRLQGSPHIVEFLGVYEDKKTGRIYLVTEKLKYSGRAWLKVRRLGPPYAACCSSSHGSLTRQNVTQHRFLGVYCSQTGTALGGSNYLKEVIMRRVLICTYVSFRS